MPVRVNGKAKHRLFIERLRRCEPYSRVILTFHGCRVAFVALLKRRQHKSAQVQRWLLKIRRGGGAAATELIGQRICFALLRVAGMHHRLRVVTDSAHQPLAG